MNLHQAIQVFGNSHKGSWYLYGLEDPRTGIIRYVGQTVQPRRRFQAYLAGNGAKHSERLMGWLAALQRLCLAPNVHIVGIYPSQDEADENERDWIADLRAAYGKHQILNICDGGAGVPEKGRMFSEEHRKRLSEAAKRRVYSPEDCEQNRQKALKAWSDPAFRRRVVQRQNEGKKMSQAFRDARRDVARRGLCRGQKRTVEQVERIRQGRLCFLAGPRCGNRKVMS